MEKIAAALERALRAEGHFPAGDPGGSATMEQPPAHGVRIPAGIEYTQTRTVEVPADILERHRVAVVSNDVTADTFRTLRTELLMQMRRNDWRVIAVASPNKGAGKSTVALNLAVSFAMEVDYTSLLVDADLRDPDLRNLLGIGPGAGLADYLLGRSQIEDLLVHPALGNLVVLPGGAPVANSSELMRSPMMADMVRELRDRYENRMVVFDVPPVLSGADTLALSSYMDGVVLLVEEGKTSREELERACALLSHANVIGIVLNKSRELPTPDPIRWPERRSLWRRVLGQP
jgi:capsular exopolysaccharide synthesis family protein